MRGGAVLGGLAAAPVLAACGGGGEKSAATTAAATTAAETTTPAATTTATETAAELKRFDELKVGVAAPPLGLDPHKTTSTELSAFPQMFEPLLARMPDRSLLPALAAGELERVDDVTWRATLREGRTFTDGSPITADDVKFSFDRVLDPKYASAYAGYLSFFESITVVDPATIEFKATVPTDLVPDRVAIVRVVKQSVVEQKGDEEFAKNPEVGSGSMINAEPLGQSRILLKAYEGYNGVLPVYADKASWNYIREAETRVAQLDSGQLHIADTIPQSLVETIRSSQNLDVGMSDLQASTFLATAMFNCGKKPFSDQRVRQAFMYALDREQLVQIGDLGQGVVADSPLPAANPYHATPTVVYGHDPERAKALLKEAGYPDGISFELHISNIANVKEYAPLIQQQIKEAGFDPKLRVVGIDEYFSQIFAGNYSLIIFPHQFEVFSYDVDMLMRGWWGGFFNEKAAFWTTPGAKQVPVLLDQALGEQDEDKKEDLYAQAQQIIVEEAGSCPMIFLPTVQAVRKDVLGYKVGFTFVTPIYGVHPA